MNLLIAELEKQRFGQTKRAQRPRKAKREHVTSDTKRKVFERDGLQRAFVDEHGKRCSARAFLERDHRVPHGKGGGSEAENIRHLCRSHNQYVAELEYGRAHIERAIARRRAQVQSRRNDKNQAMGTTGDDRGASVLDAQTGPDTS
ncbi:MAG TPA: HNH endonuclease signature motif containing protein [Polyangiaceae bacterium]|nr:HNH endonuclease signature motif containing protein [Polyangiaceae bacterium]